MIRIPKTTEGGCKGFAHIQFESEVERDAALLLQDIKLKDRTLVVKKVNNDSTKTTKKNKSRKKAKI
jgi:RNA recognition motif-containing protein